MGLFNRKKKKKGLYKEEFDDEEPVFESRENNEIFNKWKSIDQGNFCKKFLIVGTQYENRQPNWEKIMRGTEVDLHITEYEGSPAVEVKIGENSLGWVIKKDAKQLHQLDEFIIGSKIVSTEIYENNKTGKVEVTLPYNARIELLKLFHARAEHKELYERLKKLGKI